MPDSSAIDQSVVDKLSGDATLMAMVPHGIYFDEGPAGMTKFVVVSLVQSFDNQQFGGRAFEDATYLVKAVMLSTAGGNIKAAAARIDTVLDGATLTATGYSHMVCQRTERIRYTDVDANDTTLRWLHRGGHYQVNMGVV